MRTLTVKECKATQMRHKDHWGNKHPYKGQWHDSASPYSMKPVKLPKGWVFVSILTWGLYIRKINDTDYMNDL